LENPLKFIFIAYKTQGTNTEGPWDSIGFQTLNKKSRKSKFQNKDSKDLKIIEKKFHIQKSPDDIERAMKEELSEDFESPKVFKKRRLNFDSIPIDPLKFDNHIPNLNETENIHSSRLSLFESEDTFMPNYIDENKPEGGSIWDISLLFEFLHMYSQHCLFCRVEPSFIQLWLVY